LLDWVWKTSATAVAVYRLLLKSTEFSIFGIALGGRDGLLLSQSKLFSSRAWLVGDGGRFISIVVFPAAAAAAAAAASVSANAAASKEASPAVAASTESKSWSNSDSAVCWC
jgi:hypothetical protein